MRPQWGLETAFSSAASVALVSAISKIPTVEITAKKWEAPPGVCTCACNPSMPVEQIGRLLVQNFLGGSVLKQDSASII